MLRAQIAFVSRRGNDAAPLLLAASRRLAELDPALARETYLELCRRRCSRDALPDQVRCARGCASCDVRRRRRRTRLRGPDLLLDGLVTRFCDGYEAAVPILRQSQSRFGDDASASDQLRWMWLATLASVQIWDDAGWDALSERHVRLARESGALADLQLRAQPPRFLASLRR